MWELKVLEVAIHEVSTDPALLDHLDHGWEPLNVVVIGGTGSVVVALKRPRE